MPKIENLSRRSGSRGGFRATVLLAVGSLFAAVLVSVTTTPAVSASDPCGPSGNAISCENSKPGSPRQEWDDVQGAGDSDIQGFTTDISTNVGGRVDFKIDTSASAYSINIYRTGWYGGDGARKIATIAPSAALPQAQPQCITDATTELYDCGNWGVSASWSVPSTAVSGVYVALLRRNDNQHTSQVTFVVRDDSSHSSIVFQTSDPTWQAYNTYGGSDFYQGAANGRSYKISYNRPVLTRGGTGGRDFYFSNEYPAVEFMERNGYDVSYQAGVDTDRYGSLLTNHKTFMSVGHDEYWSKGQRANVEAARDAGVNLMFLSGNEVYWKTRYEASADASKTSYRTLVSYKETWANAKIDPSDEWTGTWRDPRFAPKSKGGGVPENGLTGTMYMANTDDIPMQVTADQGKSRLWRNTTVASLGAGQTATLAKHTIGYESDEDVDNGSRPAGLVKVTTTTGPTPEYLTDFGSTVVPGTTTHSMTLYKASSGALVFGAGTIQYTWGLDATHDSPFAAEAADPRMQQFQVNLFADFGAQPTTLQSGLVAATKSTDTTGPTSTITSPAASTSIANGTSVTATGTAVDNGGGIVAGVEVSTDGGTSWHPATGTSSWTYTYVQHDVGAAQIMVRATDDSANIGAVASRAITVSCGCSVFGAAVPATVDSGDAGAVELGLRFKPNSAGIVTGVRFYKAAANTGTHVGSLWSTDGTRLATVTFSNESASGWQQAAFSVPVPVTAGTTYVVSYTTPTGHYAATNNAFYSSGVDADPLTVDGGYGATAAGVYGNSGTFPNNSFGSTNYWVDVVYNTTDAAPLTAGNQWPLPGSSSVPASTTVSATFGKAIAANTQSVVVKDANGATVAGTTAYDATTRTVTFTPTAPLNGFVVYTATVNATDPAGNPVTTGKTWSFTTAKPSNAPGVCPCSIFDDNTVPTLLEDTDSAAVTLGVRFTSDVDGTITGVRFYKGVNNTGAHTGTLWSADGTALATGIFTNESTTGWQDLTFTSPVAITKNTQYVASYRTTVGKYSASPNAFGSADLSKAPLRVTSTSGAYTYGTGFPSSTSATSYLVDVVFQKAAPSIAVTAQSPANGATSVDRATTVKTTFSAPIATTGYTETVTSGTTNAAVPGSTVLSADGTVLTFTPTGTLPADSDVKVVLSGVTSVDGAALATQTWTFHTAAAAPVATQTLFGSLTPTTTATADDGSSVELGASFTPAKDGTVSAIRFFKGTGNNGVHVGSLWSATGTKLASVTFTGETASGWQTATLASPISVTAGTSYVVSYLAPQGHYAATPNFFATAYTSGDLSARATTNGLYLYGTGGFPTFSYNATNYFVDVVYAPAAAGPATMTTAARAPASGSTGAATTSAPSITFSSALATGYTLTAKAGATAIAGVTTLSTDAKTLTFTPTAALPADTDITMTANGIIGANGALLGTDTWTFHTAAAAPAATLTVASRTPAAGATAVVRTTKPTITFSSAINAGYTVTAKNGATAIAGTTALSADKLTLTFTPSATLPASASITMAVTGVTGANGATLASDTWSFTTAAATVATASLFATSTPTSTTGNNFFASEYGTSFVPSTAGTVTAIKFYKATTMTGTHTGSIWSSAGVKLATVTFTGETASGWQTATLATPLALTAGTTYVVSYYSPNGRYVSSSSFFPATGSYTSGVLSAATAANGVYRLGSTGFPSTRSARTNYFVDVVFSYTS